MTHYAQWASYTGSASIILASVLLVITGVLVFVGLRLHKPIEFKRPGVSLSAFLALFFLLAAVLFLVAAGVYGTAVQQQGERFTGPANTIFPYTATLGLVTFALIAFMNWRYGFWVAVISAIVGAIAAPMIFELPFDLIVMGRTYPPNPGALYTLLYFLPLFLIELSSFAMLTISPVMRVTRWTLLFLAGMFLVFAIWALAGFAYPVPPLPITLNVISKTLAFLTAISLFTPPGLWRTALASGAWDTNNGLT
ncbi:MAG TPA: hypothetical protein VHI51_19950 [Ktedonobacterales bacterium]|nr:hypothetical protein [Ktedonobacterales bacterium]